MAQGDIDLIWHKSDNNITRNIRIEPTDPHFDAVAWAKEKADAELMAEAHYRNAVLTGQDLFKIAFFEATKRAKDIGVALDHYFHS